MMQLVCNGSYKIVVEISLMQVFKVLKVSCRYWWWSCTLAIWDLGLVHVYIVAGEMLCVLKKLTISPSHEGA